MAMSFARQADITVARLPAHLRRKPVRRLKASALTLVMEFHLGNSESLVASAVNIDLNHMFSKWNVVTRLGQTAARRGGPELFKLIACQINFNLLSRQAPAPFHRQGMTPAGFAQTDLRAVSLHGEITLFDRSAVKMAQIRRKPLQKKFAFNLTRRLAVFSCSDHRGDCEFLCRA